MVDVAHDHNDRGAGYEILGCILVVVDQALFDGNNDFFLDLAAHLHGDKGRGIIVDHVRDGGKGAQLEELLDNLGRGLLHAGGQLADRDLVRDHNLDRLLLDDLAAQTVHLIALFLTALVALRPALHLLAVLVADLLALAAAAGVAHRGGVSLRSGQILELLVIFFNVDRAAAGIDHALLGHLARLMRFVLLFALCRSRSRALLLRLRLGLSLGLSALRLGFLSAAVLLLALCLCGSRLILGFLRLYFKNILQTGDLIVLGQVFKDDIQLFRLQYLHVVLRRRGIVGKDLTDILCCQAKILGHLMYSILIIDHNSSSLNLLAVLAPLGLIKTLFHLLSYFTITIAVQAKQQLDKGVGKAQVGDRSHRTAVHAEALGQLRLIKRQWHQLYIAAGDKCFGPPAGVV